jgi:1-acyl-sn-glycerol-3-phosphate acyltransferase
VRAAVRLVLLCATTAILYVAFVLARNRRIIRLWALCVSKILGLRATVNGPRPAGTFLLATNHISYVDIVLLAQSVDVGFVAKAEVGRWPVIGRLASAIGTLFIDRRSPRDGFRVAEQITRLPHAVAFFPEGTSSDGTAVLPFKPMLFEFAARSGMPVHYATLSYAQPEVAWYGDMQFLPHLLALLRLPRIDASLRFGGCVVSRDRKDLAQRLWSEISSAAMPKNPLDQPLRHVVDRRVGK